MKLVGASGRLYVAALMAALLLLTHFQISSANAVGNCRKASFRSASYTTCKFVLPAAKLKLFLRGPDGSVFGSFGVLTEELGNGGKTLKFAMNAGMYHADRSPVGLFIEDQRRVAPLNLSDGYGNFFMKPNGIFYVDRETAGVLEANAFRKRRLSPDFATQSGPMLVIDGKLHPRFLAGSSSRKIRNGVGVSADGKRVWFAISDEPVNFHSFAKLFRDSLKTPNALYLDGVVSQLYAPELTRHDRGVELGPIVGVIE